MSKIDAWDSKTFIQAVFAIEHLGTRSRLLDAYAAFHRVVGMNGGARVFLRERLGKQDYTWNGSVRNWIWEGRDGVQWRAFASKRGFTLEIAETATPDETQQAWTGFLERMKVTL